MKFTCLLLVFLLSLNEASRILVLDPLGSKSHRNSFVSLVRALANRDHHVTYLTTFPSTEFQNSPNVREILHPQSALEDFGYDFFKGELEGSVVARLKLATSILNLPRGIAENVYDNKELQQVIKEKYDLLVINQAFAAIFYPYVWKTKVPFILLSPNIMLPGSGILMGDNEHSELVPHYFSSYTDRMTFYQRTINTLMVSFFSHLTVPLMEKYVYSIALERFPDLPPVEEISKNVSLIFANSHPIFNYPRVLPPDVIEVGAMHCRPAEPLPQVLEDFVSGAAEGFVVFAIGSAVPMKDMPKDILNSFIKVLSKLPQRVVWQWKGPKPEGISSNILLLDWLPQQDLLGHKNCKGFITHGGLSSLQEAVYHGVPVLGLPFGTDQQLNLGKTVLQGNGLKLEWADVDEESLTNNLDKLLNNTKYSSNAKRLQSLFRDQPQTPVERAVFWTEHVMRHGGTAHLRLASRDMNMIQRLGIDVFVVFLVTFLVISISCLGCLKFCWRKTFKTSRKVKTN